MNSVINGDVILSHQRKCMADPLVNPWRGAYILQKLYAGPLPCAVGLLILLVGFSLDPLWPAQDMSPEIVVQYRQNTDRAKRIYLWVAIVFACGAMEFLGHVWFA